MGGKDLRLKSRRSEKKISYERCAYESVLEKQHLTTASEKTLLLTLLA